MVASLFHPLNIFFLGLSGGFLIPLLDRLGKIWVPIVFVLALAGMTLISGVSLLKFMAGAPPIEILTGGSTPPYSINLRLGMTESAFSFGVSLVTLLGAVYFVRAKYAVMLIYLIMVMGIQGMVMTRDLFNLFVFLEIVSVATYGLLSLRDTPAAASAAFKYLMATVIASTFFLLGTVLLYAVTGMLNIDDLIGRGNGITGPIGFAALMFLLASLLIELKPFPANGWGLDVYETAQPGVAASISVGVSAGVFFTLLKLLPLFQGWLEIIAASGAVTFLASNLIGLMQTKAQRLLGYSSIGQMGLLMMALALLRQLDMDNRCPAGRRRSVRQSPVCKSRLVLARRSRRQGAHGWLVDPGGSPSPDSGICHAARRHRRLPALSRLLGEVASGDDPGRGGALSLDCDCAAGHIAGGGLSVPMVWQCHPFLGAIQRFAGLLDGTDSCFRGGDPARHQRVFRGDPRRSVVILDIPAARCGTPAVPSRRVVRAAQGSACHPFHAGRWGSGWSATCPA